MRLAVVVPFALCACGPDVVLTGGGGGDDASASTDDTAGSEVLSFTVPEVAVTPSAPTSSDDLQCALLTPAEASTGTEVTHTLTWLRDGEDAGVNSELLSYAATERDETWTCAVTPSAEDSTGQAGTAEVMIGNSPPSGLVVEIAPTNPYEGVDDLVCSIAVAAADEDGDTPAYTFVWTRNGDTFKDATTTDMDATVPALATFAGEQWRCEAVPSDDQDPGESAEASVEISACDADDDGHDAEVCGGDDCDDEADSVHPGAEEICNNGLDDDCDGTANECGLSGEYSTAGAASRWGVTENDTVGTRQVGGVDLDGDGFQDWVVGGYGHSGANEQSGIAWVVRGPLTGQASLATAYAEFEGEGRSDLAGLALAVSEDITGDDLPDVIIGGSGSDAPGSDAGRAYLVSGPVTGGMNLADADVVLSGTEVDGRFAYDLAIIPALDASGEQGLLVGAYGLTDGGKTGGGAYVMAGPLWGDGDADDAQATLLGESDGDYVGQWVDAGDVDGDGISDILLGSDQHDGSAADAGALYVVYGPVSGTMSLADADHELWGEDASDNAGAGLAVVGDVNADGLADALVGARGVGVSGSGSRDGQAYLVLGPMSISALYAAHGELRGESGGDRAGLAVASAGDVDADGFDDMLVGSYENAVGGEHAGAGYLVYGPVTGRVSLASADARFRGAPGDYMGRGFASGDHDGDGFSDILVGAMGVDTNGDYTGAVYLFEGGGM